MLCFIQALPAEPYLSMSLQHVQPTLIVMKYVITRPSSKRLSSVPVHSMAVRGLLLEWIQCYHAWFCFDVQWMTNLCWQEVKNDNTNLCVRNHTCHWYVSDRGYHRIFLIFASGPRVGHKRPTQHRCTCCPWCRVRSVLSRRMLVRRVLTLFFTDIRVTSYTKTVTNR